ncbi:uncharacterized protein BDV17DRAFT_290367 [Aspergillus undulatus]|uniref:uncharacterized protein n=1 Tax=Aspergillus undulatus TaxID=1810928 RepID=UPI003CCE24C2
MTAGALCFAKNVPESFYDDIARERAEELAKANVAHNWVAASGVISGAPRKDLDTVYVHLKQDLAIMLPLQKSMVNDAVKVGGKIRTEELESLISPVSAVSAICWIVESDRSISDGDPPPAHDAVCENTTPLSPPGGEPGRPPGNIIQTDRSQAGSVEDYSRIMLEYTQRRMVGFADTDDRGYATSRSSRSSNTSGQSGKSTSGILASQASAPGYAQFKIRRESIADDTGSDSAV